MKFHVLTLFPGMFTGPFDDGVVAKARKSGKLEINFHNIRDHTVDRHQTVDDYVFGGGAGMLMKPEPIFAAVEFVRTAECISEEAPVILTSPQGRRLTQRIVEDLAKNDDIVLICGRYEGIDDRVRQHLATDEISIGDYVLGGGELGAMVIIEAVSRLGSGVVGSIESIENDSLTTGILQHPQYTRPARFKDMEVPEMLLSGNHAEIKNWRREQALRRTFYNRPDLLKDVALSQKELMFIQSLRNGELDF